MQEHTPESFPFLPDVDLDPARWREYDDLITDSLWLLGARDRSGPHTSEYWGNFVPQIPHQIVRRFTRRGEVVLDLFCGLATTLIECRRLGRHSIGVDLNPDIVRRGAYIAGRADNPYDVTARVLEGDSSSPEIIERIRRELSALSADYADCVILHPPYHNVIRFSDDPRDLSNSATLETFLEQFRRVVSGAHELLAPRRHMALVIGDRYIDSEWVPLGFECMSVCRQAGFKLKAINVKDIQGNERGKGKNTNLWRYRALKQGLYVFRHEYVMLFQKRG